MFRRGTAKITSVAVTPRQRGLHGTFHLERTATRSARRDRDSEADNSGRDVIVARLNWEYLQRFSRLIRFRRVLAGPCKRAQNYRRPSRNRHCVALDAIILHVQVACSTENR